MSFSGLLEHTGSLYYPINTQDASGGTVVNYTLAQARIPCAIFGVDGNEQLRFAQSGIVVTHKIYADYALAKSGWKFVDDTERSYILHSIRKQPGMGGIDTFWKWIGEELLPGA